MSKGPSIGLAPVSWREFGLVVMFGGIGGFLSWIYIITVGQPLLQTWWKAIPASIVLGMGASFIGVYVIANSDTRALFRCLGFALLCGFSWKPVYDAGGALIKQTTTRHAEQQVLNLSKTSQKLASALSKTPPELLPSKINETTKTTTDLLWAFFKVDNPNIRSQVQSRAREAMTAIKNVTTQNPEEAAKALTEIGTVAVETKEPQTADLTIQLLGGIGVEAKEKPGWHEAQYRLGLALVGEGNYQEAVDLLRETKVTPAQAFEYCYGLAYASIRLGRKQEAAGYAQEGRPWAKDPADKARLEELIVYIESR